MIRNKVFVHGVLLLFTLAVCVSAYAGPGRPDDGKPAKQVFDNDLLGFTFALHAAEATWSRIRSEVCLSLPKPDHGEIRSSTGRFD